MNCYRFKLFLSENDIRRFSLTAPVSLEKLQTTLASYVNVNQAGRLMYLDNEKEWISLTNQQEWQEAQSMKPRCFKLRFSSTESAIVSNDASPAVREERARQKFTALAQLGESGLRNMKPDELTQWFPNLINRAKNQGKYQESMTAYDLIQQFPGLSHRLAKHIERTTEANSKCEVEPTRPKRRACPKFREEELRQMRPEDLTEWFPNLINRAKQQNKYNGELNAYEFAQQFPRVFHRLTGEKVNHNQTTSDAHQSAEKATTTAIPMIPLRKPCQRPKFMELAQKGEDELKAIKGEELTRLFPPLIIERAKKQGKYQEGMSAYDLLQQCPCLLRRIQRCTEKNKTKAEEPVRRPHCFQGFRGRGGNVVAWMKNRAEFIHQCRQGGIALDQTSAEELLKWFPAVRYQCQKQEIDIGSKTAADIVPLFPRLQKVLSPQKHEAGDQKKRGCPAKPWLIHLRVHACRPHHFANEDTRRPCRRRPQ